MRRGYRLRGLLLQIEVDRERERAQQQQVNRQDDERSPAAHPAAELLDAHGADRRPEATDSVAYRASATPKRAPRRRSCARLLLLVRPCR